MIPHFTALEAAFQLRYYLCLKTKCLKPTLNLAARELTPKVLAEVCARESYHLLETAITDTYLGLLLSLTPQQTVSKTVRMLKGNLQRQFGKNLDTEVELARGYFARSSGRVDLDQVRQYVETQVPHHGYQGNWTQALNFQNPAFVSPAFTFEHNVSILNYHMVLVTQDRVALFDEAIAPGLFDCVVAIGKKHGFVIERIGLLPDHMHLIFEGIPSVSVEEYAFAILNNTRYWMEKRYAGVLKETQAWDVWRPSYYAGTVGEFTTAQVSSFLRG